MNPLQSLTLILTLTLLNPTLKADASYPMKYEGGSLELDQHSKLKLSIAQTEVRAIQGKKNFTIPTNSITEVSYGNDVHRRVGAAIGVGVVTLGIGALMALVKTKKHYVGIVWGDKRSPDAKRGGVVFKVGKGEYRGVIAALEGITGLKAVNADTVGSGGTSKP